MRYLCVESLEAHRLLPAKVFPAGDESATTSPVDSYVATWALGAPGARTGGT